MITNVSQHTGLYADEMYDIGICDRATTISRITMTNSQIACKFHNIVSTIGHKNQYERTTHDHNNLLFTGGGKINIKASATSDFWATAICSNPLVFNGNGPIHRHIPLGDSASITTLGLGVMGMLARNMPQVLLFCGS